MQYDSVMTLILATRFRHGAVIAADKRTTDFVPNPVQTDVDEKLVVLGSNAVSSIIGLRRTLEDDRTVRCDYQETLRAYWKQHEFSESELASVAFRDAFVGQLNATLYDATGDFWRGPRNTVLEIMTVYFVSDEPHVSLQEFYAKSAKKSANGYRLTIGAREAKCKDLELARVGPDIETMMVDGRVDPRQYKGYRVLRRVLELKRPTQELTFEEALTFIADLFRAASEHCFHPKDGVCYVSPCFDYAVITPCSVKVVLGSGI